MAEFLFVFGYESPDEWRDNHTHGTDFESSDAVWIQAENQIAALAAGRAYAERRVAGLFGGSTALDWPGWQEVGYAHWIEEEPSRMWTADELQSIPRVEA